MRVSAIYVHRRPPRQSLGVLPPHSPTRQGIHNDRSVAPVCRRLLCKERSGDLQEKGSDTHAQEPAAKVRRTEQKGDEAPGSPNGRLDSASVGTTRTILQGVLDFFRRKDPSPFLPPLSLPQLPLPLPLRNIFLENHLEDQQQQVQQPQGQPLPPAEDASEDKENIPPANHGQHSAVAALQAFRQEGSLKRRRQQTDKPPPTIPLHQESSPQLTRSSTTASGPQGEATSGVYKDAAEATKKPPLRRSRPEDGLGSVQVSYRQFVWFTQLAESPEIQKFLKRDICYRYADKYLLAMVFTYFIRAGLRRDQYTKKYFYAALYLAHDMEEDEEELKYEVFPWALGPIWRKSYPSLLKVRDDIFWAIHCRAVVSKRGCDQVMDMQPGCWMWQRERPIYHGGAMREYLRDPSDNGRPRGPDRSPLQCQLCLERECANSQNSYLLYLSDSASSMDTLCLDSVIATEHKDGDSGFETFLFEPCDASLTTSLDPALKRASMELRV